MKYYKFEAKSGNFYCKVDEVTKEFYYCNEGILWTKGQGIFDTVLSNWESNLRVVTGLEVLVAIGSI